MAERNNIVLILTDQLRADILSCYGGNICKTPAIDRFASESVVFERAYTPLAVCSPARASIMTGQYPHNHGVVSNGDKLFPGVLQDNPRLLSRRLEALGYDRWYNGKWHMGGEDPSHVPQKFGFPGMQLPGHGNGGYRYPEYQQYLRDKGLKLEFSEGPVKFGWHYYGTLSGPEESEVSALLADDAIRYLESRDSENPFFLWVNFWGPHAPYNTTQEYLDLYKEVEIPPWENFCDDGSRKPKVHGLKIPPASDREGWRFWEPAVRHYYAFMSLIDCQIGRILDTIERLGYKENTTVIFAADHGESIGAHGCQDKGHFMYEETYRIPLMIRLPEQAPRKDDSLVSLVDLCPTILAFAGDREPETGRDGLSLRPYLLEEASEPRNTVVGEFHGLVTPFTQRMAIDKRYKYVWNMGDMDELYDLSEDPYELNNRIEDRTALAHVRRLQQELLQWMVRTRDGALSYYERYLQHQEGCDQ